MNSDKFWIILNDNSPKLKYPTLEKADAAASKTARHCRGEKFYVMGLEQVIYSDLELIKIKAEGGE